MWNIEQFERAKQKKHASKVYNARSHVFIDLNNLLMFCVVFLFHCFSFALHGTNARPSRCNDGQSSSFNDNYPFPSTRSLARTNFRTNFKRTEKWTQNENKLFPCRFFIRLPVNVPALFCVQISISFFLSLSLIHCLIFTALFRTRKYHSRLNKILKKKEKKRFHSNKNVRRSVNGVH